MATKKSETPRPAFPSIPKTSSFSTSHKFNGVDHNKSIQSLRRRDAGGIRDPFAADKSILQAVTPRNFTTYSRAEAVEPFIKPVEELQSES